MSDEIISLREFARRLNVGEKTIRDGIKTGKISKGITYDDKGKPKISFAVALKEANEIGLGKKVLTHKEAIPPKQKTIHTKPNIPKDTASIGTNGELELVFDGDLSYANALKKKENYNALLKELEYKKMEGSLVDKKEMYTQLFDFHQGIRNSLLSIPDRIIDTVLSFGNDRNKAHQLIYEAIAGELDKLKSISDEV